MTPIRVLVVDDSAVVRQVLVEILSHDPQIEVVGTAVDPYDARQKIKDLKPDVLTLDIEMPRMDGVTFLRNLMRLRPMPVIMISTLTHEGADITLEALQVGAIDYIPKPVAEADEKALDEFRQSLYAKVKAAASASNKLKFIQTPSSQVASKPVAKAPLPEFNGQYVIAIGASTGGTEALREVVSALPANIPPVIITQHIPESFSARFARRLDTYTDLVVVHAEDGQILEGGHVYIAPGDQHMKIDQHGHKMICRLNQGPAVNRHRPSVEVMFDSVLELDCKRSVAVMLTGMGDDGAESMKRLRDAGVHTIAQDEATSLVWGMPGSAVKLDAADQVLGLNQVANAIVNALKK